MSKVTLRFLFNDPRRIVILHSRLNLPLVKTNRPKNLLCLVKPLHVWKRECENRLISSTKNCWCTRYCHTALWVFMHFVLLISISMIWDGFFWRQLLSIFLKGQTPKVSFSQVYMLAILFSSFSWNSYWGNICIA